jgi:MinD superfamily P-loop ATPase
MESYTSEIIVCEMDVEDPLYELILSPQPGLGAKRLHRNYPEVSARNYVVCSSPQNVCHGTHKIHRLLISGHMIYVFIIIA